MLRAKLSALSLSDCARKAGDFQSIENPARRIRLALFRTLRLMGIESLPTALLASFTIDLWRPSPLWRTGDLVVLKSGTVI